MTFSVWISWVRSLIRFTADASTPLVLFARILYIIEDKGHVAQHSLPHMTSIDDSNSTLVSSSEGLISLRKAESNEGGLSGTVESFPYL